MAKKTPKSTKRTATKKTNKNTAKNKKTKKTNQTNNNDKALYILIILALTSGLFYALSNMNIELDKVKPKVDKKSAVVGTNENQTEKKQKIITNETTKSEQDLKQKKQNVIIKPKNDSIKSVKVYFLYYNHNNDKIQLKPVYRKVKQNKLLVETMNQLVKGPNKYEKSKGFVNSFTSDFKILDVSVINNIAIIDVNEAIENGGSANIIINRINQIVYTATQFDNVKGVHLLINGKKKKYLGSDGIAISDILKPD